MMGAMVNLSRAMVQRAETKRRNKKWFQCYKMLIDRLKKLLNGTFPSNKQIYKLGFQFVKVRVRVHETITCIFPLLVYGTVGGL